MLQKDTGKDLGGFKRIRKDTDDSWKDEELGLAGKREPTRRDPQRKGLGLIFVGEDFHEVEPSSGDIAQREGKEREEKNIDR